MVDVVRQVMSNCIDHREPQNYNDNIWTNINRQFVNCFHYFLVGMGLQLLWSHVVVGYTKILCYYLDFRWNYVLPDDDREERQ